ncbi:MAG TPA: PPOX class F420-dependent oxidoreductase [Ktedonobacterales bacterium]|nr:PPOX class F420-dependent oxidoreductase [Ktedonobacterales bacterium]
MQLQENVRAFLKEPRFGVFATSKRDGTPQQSVVWYDLDGDDILMNTAVGRAKNSNLRRDSRASLCVADDYRYVTLEGTVELDDDPATAQADIRRLAIRYRGEEKGNQQADNVYAKQRRVTIRFKVENVIVYQLD